MKILETGQEGQYMTNRGYLLAIEGKEFPLEYMVCDSWECTPNRKTTKQYKDGYGKVHESETEHARTQIEFQIEEHRMSDHEEIISFFQKTKEVTATYLNDGTGTYDTGVFRIKDIKWKHKKTFKDDIWYEKTKVTMEEY